MRGLVVDDSAVIRRILSGALRSLDFLEIDEATNGREAVEAATNRPYNLILIEWTLPRMGGLDAVRAMRAQGVTAPIIMVSAEAGKTNIIDALKAGVQNYVIKPFDLNTLTTKIREALKPPRG